MKHWLLAATLVCFGSTAFAQASDSLADLAKWVGTQQAQVGTSIAYDGTKYAATWWDLASYGSKGTNVGLAGASDYLDLGPGVAAANGRATRYGQAVPVHIGNIWNALQAFSSGSWMSHVHITSLPNVTVCPFFLFPANGDIRSWNWKKDFQGAIGYRFGGTP